MFSPFLQRPMTAPLISRQATFALSVSDCCTGKDFVVREILNFVMQGKNAIMILLELL